MTRRLLLVAAILATLVANLPAVAEESKSGGEAQFAKLIEQLDAPRFVDRQAAQQKLADLRKSALPQLEKAAESENREVSGRAMEVLQRHFEGEDESLKAAAKESLDRLAIHPSESVARRAKEIVSPPKPEPPAPIQNIPNLRIGGARIQIQVGNLGGNVKRVSVKSVNGVKEIEAVEPGRKVKIIDDPANGIQLEVTETKEGKETTKKYEAKNADELRTKHPEAHKLYAEFAQVPAGIAIPGAQIGGIGGGLPAAPGAPRVPNRRRLKILRPQEVEAAREDVKDALENLEASLDTLRKAAEQNDELKGAVEKAEAAKKGLLELQGKLDS